MRRICSTLIAVAAFASTTFARTDISYLLKPWGKDMQLETEVDAYLAAEGTTDNSTPITLGSIAARGRFRLSPEKLPWPVIGIDFDYIRLDTSDARLPGDLTDQAIGFGTPIKQVDKWVFAVMGAVGYAGEAAYSDGNALYVRGDIAAILTVDDNTSWIFVIDYDGNRTLYPDLPFPAFAYQHKVSEQLSYTLGVPFCQLSWKPTKDWEIEARYAPLFNVNILATYNFVEHWEVFGLVKSQAAAFQLANAPDGNRVFYDSLRLEVGIAWNPRERVHVGVGVGYLIGQEIYFDRDGWDPPDGVELSDEIFGALEVSIKF